MWWKQFQRLITVTCKAHDITHYSVSLISLLSSCHSQRLQCGAISANTVLWKARNHSTTANWPRLDIGLLRLRQGPQLTLMFSVSLWSICKHVHVHVSLRGMPASSYVGYCVGACTENLLICTLAFAYNFQHDSVGTRVCAWTRVCCCRLTYGQLLRQWSKLLFHYFVFTFSTWLAPFLPSPPRRLLWQLR